MQGQCSLALICQRTIYNHLKDCYWTFEMTCAGNESIGVTSGSIGNVKNPTTKLNVLFLCCQGLDTGRII
jgi:hypothetical protein